MSNTSSTDTITVNASGTPAGGKEAHFYVTADGVNIGNATVTSTAENYTFSTALTSGVAHNIVVHYNNDTVIGTQDRNLTVNSLSVNGQVNSPTASDVTYHVTNGSVLPGQSQMSWNGALDFHLPASEFGATTTTPITPVSPPVVVSPPVTTPTAPSEPTPPVTTTTPPATTTTSPAYYVEMGGSDTANGLAASASGANSPFATLSHAITAAEASGIHTIYVGAGDFQLSSTVNLGAADSGLSILAAPGTQPILDGSNANLSTLLNINGANNVTVEGLTFSHASSTGYALVAQNSTGDQINGNLFSNNGNGLRLIGASGNTISGNEIDHSALSGMEIQDGSNNNVIDSNLINGTGASGTTGGGIFMHGVNNNTISHNQVENTAGMGIGVENWDGTTINVGNNITNNVLTNTNLTADDSGAIYVLDRSHVSTNMTISGNIINNYGTSANHSMGIYLDDMTSGATVTSNEIIGSGTDAIQIHGGDHNTITNNVADLGSGNTGFALIQSDPDYASLGDGMQANVISKNIVTSTSATPHAYDYLSGGTPQIAGNVYWDPTPGATWPNAAPTQDATAVLSNPQFTAQAQGNYSVASTSPAVALGFANINTSEAGLHPLTDHWAYSS